MRYQRITRVIDARAGQGRVIIHLDCKHNVSLTEVDLISLPAVERTLGLTVLAPRTLINYPCPTCEDEPQDKSANQLWKEAGEP